MICVTLHGDSLEALAAQLASLDSARSTVDRRVGVLAELRLDTLASVPSPAQVEAFVEAFVRGSPLPLLATCRPTREGGRFVGSEPARLELLRAAARGGAAWVDVEAWALEDLGRATLGDARVLVSQHTRLESSGEDFEREVEALLDALPRADAHKLALPVSDAREALTLLRIAQARVPTIVIGMGSPGVATRTLATGPWTYACLGEPIAPGQRSVQDLLALGVARSAERLFGVIGRPLAHSRSPYLMNAVCERAGVPARYTWLETEDPAGLLDAAERDPRWEGFSVTLPHKAALLSRCEPSPEVRAAGALNTLVRTPAGWAGHNTDALATRQLARAATGELGGVSVALLGNGGAARAAASVLRDAGAEVTVFGRDLERVQAFASELGVRAGGTLGDVPSAAESAAPRLVLNATSVGMEPESAVSPVRAEVFGPETIAYDLVYTPVETRFLRDARARGARAITGAEHFFAQARAQVGLFFGEEVRADLPSLEDTWWFAAARLEA